MNADKLPDLPLAAWQDTLDTLHMWSQIVGKIDLAQTPLVNHFWNSTLRVGSRGLTTLIMPYGTRSFQMGFDFIDHELFAKCDDGTVMTVKLRSITVADFYAEVMEALRQLDIEIKIWPMPVEVADPIRFTEDTKHRSYDPEYANRFWRILVWADRVFKEFRSRFVGKSSPVQFFWGSFDLAVTRFNGERAPERLGADPVTREAYSHKVISHGFWCGGGAVAEPAFYAYAAPEPDGLSGARVNPAAGYYHPEMKEFILTLAALRESATPEQDLLDFMQSTYAAAADLANWKRDELERR